MHNKILIIEDDLGLAIPLKEYFEDNGLETLHVTTGEEGLILYGAKLPNLILLDIILPKMNGFEVISEIRNKDLNIPIIMMTGTEFNSDNQIRGYELGAINYMQKPVLPKALLSLIQHILILPKDFKQYSLGRCLIRLQGQTVEIDSERFSVREKDIRLLGFLLDRVNQAVLRSTLLKQIWHDDHPDKNNLLDGAILRVRRLFKTQKNIQINTIYGNGYVLAVRPEVEASSVNE